MPVFRLPEKLGIQNPLWPVAVSAAFMRFSLFSISDFSFSKKTHPPHFEARNSILRRS
jgi:hypothetical protein